MIYLYLICSLGFSVAFRNPRQDYATKTDYEMKVSYKNPFVYTSIGFERENDSLYVMEQCRLSYTYRSLEITTENLIKTAKAIDYQTSQIGLSREAKNSLKFKISLGAELYTEDWYQKIEYSPYLSLSIKDIKCQWSFNRRYIGGKYPLIKNVILLFDYARYKDGKEDWSVKIEGNK